MKPYIICVSCTAHVFQCVWCAMYVHVLMFVERACVCVRVCVRARVCVLVSVFSWYTFALLRLLVNSTARPVGLA